MACPKGLCTRTTSRRVEQEESIIDSALMEQSPPLELDAQSAAVLDLASTSGNTFEVDQLDDNPFVVVHEDSNIDTMPYPYPRYTDGADAEAHVCAFISVCTSLRGFRIVS